MSISAFQGGICVFFFHYEGKIHISIWLFLSPQFVGTGILERNVGVIFRSGDDTDICLYSAAYGLLRECYLYK